MPLAAPMHRAPRKAVERPHWAVLVLLAALFGAGRARAQPMQIDPQALAEIERFAERWQAVTTVTYRMRKRERMRDGEVVFEEAQVKLRRPAPQVYMKRLKPRAGQEVLYDGGSDKAKLVAHPGRFPDLTLRLNIEGGLATRDQHHTIDDTGYQQVLDVLRASLAEAQKAPHGGSLRYLGERTLFERTAVGIELQAGTSPPRHVKALKDESLFAFARRTGMDAYVVYAANPAIDDLTDELDEGHPYLVPPYYAHRARIWFDRATGLPLQVTMWDAQGREYEHYEHLDLSVGVQLSARDFSQDNPAYDF